MQNFKTTVRDELVQEKKLVQELYAKNVALPVLISVKLEDISRHKPYQFCLLAVQ